MIIGHTGNLARYRSVCAGPIACLTNWAAALKDRQQGEPIIPTEYRRNVPWGLLDLGMVVIIVGMCAGVGVQMVARAVGIDNPSFTEMIDSGDQGRLFLIFGTATLISSILCYIWLYVRYGRICGFNRDDIGHDVELGMRWFVMLVVPFC